MLTIEVMMYLTKLILNPNNFWATRAKRSPGVMHSILGTISTHTRILWYLENNTVYIQHLDDLYWNYLDTRYASMIDQRNTKEFNPIFKQGQQLRFSLDVYAPKRPGKDLGKTVEIYRTQQEVEDWFQQNGNKHGFFVLRGNSHQIQISDVVKGKKVTYTMTRLTGTLEITEPNQFLQKIVQGFGRRRAFGLGLLRFSL